MSKNNNPQTRPGAVRRRRPKAQASAPAPRVEKSPSKLRRFLPVVLIPHGVAVLLVFIVAVASLMFTATSMVNLPATVAQLWLGLNLGAVSGSGQVIAALAMLPALIFIWSIAKRIHRAVKDRVSIADLAVLAGLTLGIPLILTAIACMMLQSASGVLDVGVPPLLLLLRILLLHAAALFLGMGPRLWRALARRYSVPEMLIDATTQAIRFLIAFAIVSLFASLIMMAVNYDFFMSSLNGYEEKTAVLGLILMSILYLPNIVIYAMGTLIGAPFYFGEGSISLFSVHLVPLPPLPALAAVPSTAPQWAVFFLLIPAIVATWIFLKNPMRLRVNLAAAVISTFFLLVLAYFAGGALGVYGYVGLNYLAIGLVFAYLAVVALLISGIDRLRASAGPELKPEVVVEEDPEEDPEEVFEAEDLEAEPEVEEPDSEPTVDEPETDDVEEEEEPELNPEEESETVVEETNDGLEQDDR